MRSSGDRRSPPRRSSRARPACARSGRSRRRRSSACRRPAGSFESLPPIGGALPSGMLSYRAARVGLGDQDGRRPRDPQAPAGRFRLLRPERRPRDLVGRGAVRGGARLPASGGGPARGRAAARPGGRAGDRRLLRRRGSLARRVLPDADERARGPATPSTARPIRCCSTRASICSSGTFCGGTGAAGRRRGRARSTPSRGRTRSARRSCGARRSTSRRTSRARSRSRRSRASSCMSVDHFLRSFRAACGLTPYQYVLEQRLRKASAMLKAGNTPIAEIAVQCGFGNPFALLGQVPRPLRRQPVPLPPGRVAARASTAFCAASSRGGIAPSRKVAPVSRKSTFSPPPADLRRHARSNLHRARQTVPGRRRPHQQHIKGTAMLRFAARLAARTRRAARRGASRLRPRPRLRHLGALLAAGHRHRRRRADPGRRPARGAAATVRASISTAADVTADLKASRRDHSLTGLVSGLREGVNHLKVYGPARSPQASPRRPSSS